MATLRAAMFPIMNAYPTPTIAQAAVIIHDARVSLRRFRIGWLAACDVSDASSSCDMAEGYSDSKLGVIQASIHVVAEQSYLDTLRGVGAYVRGLCRESGRSQLAPG